MSLSTLPQPIKAFLQFTVPDNDRRLLIGKRLQDVDQDSC